MLDAHEAGIALVAFRTFLAFCSALLVCPLAVRRCPLPRGRPPSMHGEAHYAETQGQFSCESCQLVITSCVVTLDQPRQNQEASER